MATVSHARGKFPVSDGFALFCPPELLTMTQEQLEAQRWLLLNMSNHRRLTDAELAYLAQVTHVCNVHSSLNAFDDWKPGDHDLPFADQLHGNSRYADCGCHVHVVFNHYDHNHVRGHRIHKKCKGHEKHTDPQALMELLQKPKPDKPAK